MSDASGATSTDPNAPASGATGNTNNETVSKADHQRALDDLNKFKKSALENEKAANDLKTRLEALENERKTSAGDFKGLYEQTKAKLDEATAREGKLKESVVRTQKHSAAQTALTKAGLKPEFLPLLEKEDFEDLVFEATSQGRFLVSGAEIYVDSFKKRFPSAFDAAKAPTINTGGGAGAGTGSPAELTIEYMNSIEKKDPKKYKELWPEFLKQWQERKRKQN